MESKVHQLRWFQSNKYCFFQSIQNFSMFKPQEIAPSGMWNRLPNLVSNKIATTTVKIVPYGTISPTLKTTGLECVVIQICASQTFLEHPVSFTFLYPRND